MSSLEIRTIEEAIAWGDSWRERAQQLERVAEELTEKIGVQNRALDLALKFCDKEKLMGEISARSKQP